MAVSWGQRKTLGKRYSVDPAMVYELERLQNEYNLAPGREARGMQASQFEKSLAQSESQFGRNLAYNTEQSRLNRELQEKTSEEQAKAGMVGSIANIGMTAPMIYYGGKAAGLWGAKTAAEIAAEKAAAALAAGATTTGTAAAGTTAAAASAPWAADLSTMGYGLTTPATTDLTTMGYGLGTGTGAGAGGGAVPVIGAETAGATAGATSTVGSMIATAAPYVAEYEAIRQTGKIGEEKGWFGKDVGTVMKTPITGVLNLGTEYLSNITGIEEIGKVGKEISRVEEQIAGGIEKTIGKVVGWVTGGCIIVTACTDRHSPEVEITRQYRDKFLDSDQLRGYYCVADRFVPTIVHNPRVREYVKKHLVDRLVDYGEYRLGLKKNRPRLSSVLVSKTFLATIKTIGMVLPQYIRDNGEVY